VGCRGEAEKGVWLGQQVDCVCLSLRYRTLKKYWRMRRKGRRREKILRLRKAEL
jgi:hypothetical protein